MTGFISTSIGKKVAMALSAFFLMIFLIMHVSVNLLSVFSATAFNEASHFMGTNWFVQFIMQPILLFGVLFHFIMGFVLEIKNHNARDIKYVKTNHSANSSWVSRNMIYSGLVILAFLVLHFIDFWFPEVKTKYILGDMSGLHEGGYRYYAELQHKFINPIRVAAYIIAFIFLGLHLAHGFTSSLQSVGLSASRKKAYKNFGRAYAIIIPGLFIIIALYHHFNH